MSRRTTIVVALVLVILGVAAQYPLQERIDRYRNTLRVTMYADARPQEIAEVENRLQKLGLTPVRGRAYDKQGQPAPIIMAEVPRKEWGGTYEKYIMAVHNADRVDQVVPGLNEQGIPLDQVQKLNIQDVGIVAIAALIGGFRKSAANVLWLQNEENWHEGKGYRTVPLARAVTMLDPYFTEAWVLTCWHLAYNMSVEAKTPDEAANLIKAGLDFIVDGIPWNSTRYEIYQEIGWTYYDKLQNYEMAAKYLQLAIAHPHPTYLERLIAHAYERIPDIDRALYWYDVSLRKYGRDDTATGAIRTIKARYVPAWELFKKGQYDQALTRLDADWQQAILEEGKEPTPTIYQHLKARIYERYAEQPGQNREQRYRQAFDTWLTAAKYSATDRLARRRVLILADNFPSLKSLVPPGFNDVGLPEPSKADSQLQPEHGSGRPPVGPQQPDDGHGHGPDDGHGHT